MNDCKIEQFRKAAYDLQSVNHRLPTVEEVANFLELNVSDCRSILREHHRTTGLSWSELGVTAYSLTEERQRLRDTLQLVSTPQSQIFLISKLLEQQRLKYLSTSETRLLVYAIISQLYTFEELDRGYSKLIGTPAKNISNRLHDTKRRPRLQKSFFERLEEEISLKAAQARDVHSREYAYREFLANVITLLRGDLKEHPFASILKASPACSEAAQLLAPHISTILERRIDPSLMISTKHAAILRSFITIKTNGLFSTLKNFAETQEIDQSGLLAALNGRGKYLGIFDKLREMEDRYQLIAPEIPNESIADLLERVRKAKTISLTDATITLKLLERCEDYQHGATDAQVQCLTLLLNDAILGKRSSTKEIAEKLGYTEDSVSQLLRDRTNRPGAIRWLDKELVKTPNLPLAEIADLLYPYSTDIAYGVVQKLAELHPVSPPLSRLYSHALSAIDSFAQQLEPPPRVLVTTRDGKNSSSRTLNSQELGKLVIGYIISAKGDLAELTRNFAKILHAKENIEISQKVAASIKRGLVTKGGVVPGAVSKLCTIVHKYRDVFEYMKATESDEGTLANIHEPSYSSTVDRNTLEVAHDIIKAPTISDSIRIAGIFCSTRPHSAREIIRITGKLVERTGHHSLRSSIHDLENELRNSSTTIDSEGFRHLLVKTLSTIPQSSKNELNLLVSCFANSCTQRRVTTRIGTHLLHMLHQSKEVHNSKVFIEVWARLCIQADNYLSKNTSRFMRAAYLRFIEVAFSSDIPLEVIKKARFQYQELLNEVATSKSLDTQKNEHAHKLLKEFYDKYSIAKVIYKYCYNHIQSKSRPKGLPFDDLYDIAVEAVLESTTKFDPERYTSVGRRAPTFSTFAVNMIQWAIRKKSQLHQRDRKGIAFSLNDQLACDDDGNSFLSVIADVSQKQSMGTEESIEGISSEEIIPLLGDLSPSLRRVVELRFFIGENILTNETRSLQKIAEILHSEGLYTEVVSSQAISVALKRALGLVRCALWRRSLPSWIKYLSSPDDSEIPSPVILPVRKHKAELTSEITLDLRGTDTSRYVALEIHRVTDGIKGEVDIFVKALQPNKLTKIALFLISIKNGRVQACERIEG